MARKLKDNEQYPRLFYEKNDIIKYIQGVFWRGFMAGSMIGLLIFGLVLLIAKH